MTKQTILSGSPWENKVGYCRAIRVGNLIEVSGTVAIVDGVTVRADDAYAQTVNIIERTGKVLEQAGASLENVVRTRMFTTDTGLSHKIGQVSQVLSFEASQDDNTNAISYLPRPR